MKKEYLSLSELQNILYDILKAFADFCDKNGLRYYLFGGTLLGAVRHNDFIPWDDDIDVSMPRPDYERFIELTRNSPWEYYEVKQYTQPFIKMVDKRIIMEERLLKESLKHQNAFIDIFPIDGLPNSKRKQKKHFKLLKLTKRLLVYRIIDTKKIEHSVLWKKIIVKLLSKILSPINFLKFRDSLNNKAKIYSYSDSEDVSVSIWGWAEKDISRRMDLEKRVAIKFRDSEFWCQGDYKETLKKKYGEYMKLPPEDKRPPFHGICYWKEGKE